MANLVIDVGNSRAKISVFDGQQLLKVETVETLTAGIINNYLASEKISKSILSSVGNDHNEIRHLLEKTTSYHEFSTSIQTQINLLYQSPETLGLDRFAAVIAANALFKDFDCLVIDAGTCITYDFVNSAGDYRGGSISPGLNMRFGALNKFTKRLPLLNINPGFDNWFGDDTVNSILSGVQQGAYTEVTGFIKHYENLHSNFKIILCGGDSEFFGSRLKNSIFAEALEIIPNLVLFGLNEVIYQHND